MRKLSMLTTTAALVVVRRIIGKSSSLLAFTALALGAVALAAGPAKAVELQGDDQFVLDFIANGDGPTNLSNFPVAVYWKWDGNQTLGIRMEVPQGSVGHGALWSFNIFCGGSSPGGLNNNGTNNTVNNISVGGAFSAASLGAYGVPIDAIEATWVQPCSGGSFDPSQIAVYIQLTILGPSGPSEVYRMEEYSADGGTYANPPDIFNFAGFCNSPSGSCAQLTFASGPDEVDIDIKPGSDQNAINMCSSGVIPVAILGSDTFDVADIVVSSLRLGDGTPESGSAVKMVGKANKELCSTEDVNLDTIDDLVCKFVTVNLNLDGGDTDATVFGTNTSTGDFTGSDSINIVKDDCLQNEE